MGEEEARRDEHEKQAKQNQNQNVVHLARERGRRGLPGRDLLSPFIRHNPLILELVQGKRGVLWCGVGGRSRGV